MKEDQTRADIQIGLGILEEMQELIERHDLFPSDLVADGKMAIQILLKDTPQTEEIRSARDTLVKVLRINMEVNDSNADMKEHLYRKYWKRSRPRKVRD